MPIDESDYTKEAVKNRLENARQVYLNSGNVDGIAAANQAISDLDAGQNSSEVELNFRKGDNFQYSGDVNNSEDDTPPINTLSDGSNNKSGDNQGIAGDTQNSTPTPTEPVQPIDTPPNDSPPVIDTTPVGSPEIDTSTVAENDGISVGSDSDSVS